MQGLVHLLVQTAMLAVAPRLPMVFALGELAQPVEKVAVIALPILHVQALESAMAPALQETAVFSLPIALVTVAPMGLATNLLPALKNTLMG
jgi:hypothetical protein